MLSELFSTRFEWWYGFGQCLVYALIIWGIGYAYFTTVGDNKEEKK